jgi:uncharacterized protein YjbI with pentapeptide repeats
MILNKKTARARWHDTEFQRKYCPLVAELTKEGSVLDGVDLAGASVGLEGPIAELWNINFYRAHITNTDMRYAQFSCSLSESIIDKTLFSEAEFDRCLIRKAQLTECDFARARLIVNLDDTTFERCNFSSARFSGGKLGIEYGGRRVKFVGCDFCGAIFKRVEFRASRFIDCIFEGASFSACDLRGVKVEGGVIPYASQFEKMDVPGWARLAPRGIA